MPSPVPFAIARSMLSFGIEYERAFSIAFCSARLVAGSAPPSFAATMIARESFEKSLPRFASAAPFLCLIVDHLLCPDTRASSVTQLEEPLVDPRVVGQLRVERRRRGRRPSRSEHRARRRARRAPRRPAPTSRDARRADEDAAERLVLALERRGRPRSSRPGARRRCGRRRGRRGRGASRSSTIIPAHVPKIGAANAADRLVEPVERSRGA